MKNCQNLSTKSYHNQTNNSNLIIKVDDIVKVDNRHFMIDSISNNTYSGTDMYGNKKDFFIDEVQAIIFDSTKQSTIEDFLKSSQTESIKENLKDINQKLKNPISSSKQIKVLKSLKKSLLKKLKALSTPIENKELSTASMF